jgi:hypothetical protein
MTRDFASFQEQGRSWGHQIATTVLAMLSAAKLDELDVRGFGSRIAGDLRDAEDELKNEGCSPEAIRIFSNAAGRAICTTFNEFRLGVGASRDTSKEN